jgi:hypothetical protein
MIDLNFYMGYNRHVPEGAAVLVVAHDGREAKKLAWEAASTLFFDEYIDLAVRRIWDEDGVRPLVDQEKLAAGVPHAIDNPAFCVECSMWGAGIDGMGACGHCGQDPGERLKRLFEEHSA